MDYWEKANHTWTNDSSRYVVTANQRTQALLYFVQEIGFFRANKPYFTERANLPSYLMKYTLAGRGRLVYQGKEYFLERGDVFFIDCADYQYYETISEDPWVMDWVHFRGNNTEDLYREFMKSGSPVFHTDADNACANPIHLIMQQLINLQKIPNARTDFDASVLIHSLLNELILQKFSLDFASEDIPDYIIEMRNFIDEHFAEEINLESLEKQFHLNKYQLNKEFSRYLGTPPIDYQITRKISAAKDLLRYSHQSIQEISLAVGIENFAYFSRLFKKKTGLSPSQYRKAG